MSLENSSGRGVLAHYGPRSTDRSYGGYTETKAGTKQIRQSFTYDDLPGGSTVSLQAYVPAGAVITDAWFFVDTAFAGGTSYDIGLEKSDGSTAIDADGLFDALVLADIDASVGVNLCASEHAGTNSGALIGAPLAYDAYLVAAATGTFTAGAATIVIEYMVPSA